MRAKITKRGLLIPGKHFIGITEAEIVKQAHRILIVPISDDPIRRLGKRPVVCAKDTSESHDRYLY
jgi:hypothetical protein